MPPCRLMLGRSGLWRVAETLLSQGGSIENTAETAGMGNLLGIDCATGHRVRDVRLS